MAQSRTSSGTRWMLAATPSLKRSQHYRSVWASPRGISGIHGPVEYWENIAKSSVSSARHGLWLLLHTADLACAGWLEFHETEPRMSSAILQKSMGPEPISTFFLPVHKAPHNQMAPSVVKMNARYCPRSQIGSLLCSKNPASIFRSLSSRRCWSNGKDTGEGLKLRRVPWSTCAMSLLQGLEATWAAVFPRDLKRWQGPQVRVPRPRVATRSEHCLSLSWHKPDSLLQIK